MPSNNDLEKVLKLNEEIANDKKIFAYYKRADKKLEEMSKSGNFGNIANT